MKKTVVLIDLGNTLVDYFTRAEWPAVLDEAIARCRTFLADEGIPTPCDDDIRRAVEAENAESPDRRVRPLEGRLARIFGLDYEAHAAGLAERLCRAFLEPVFARGRVHGETVSFLAELRRRGLRTAIVSNTPWGSPGCLWREELSRLGLTPLVDCVVFCTDVGWRKPAREIFDHALARLGATATESIFVGDDPRWDVAGPLAIDIDAVLLDPARVHGDAAAPRIDRLTALFDLLREDS